MEIMTILAQSATAYPMPVNGSNCIISASGTVQFAELERHLASGSDLGDSAFYANLEGAGTMKIKWPKNTIYVIQNTGNPMTISVMSW